MAQIYQKYEEKLKELTMPTKKDYYTYDIMNYRSGKFLYRNISEETLKEGGYEKPTTQENTREMGELLIIRNRNGEEKYKEDLEAYRACHNEIMEEFKQALFQDCGYINKKDKKIAEVIYSQAWEDGHSGGLSEVEEHFSEYDDMADKIRHIEQNY